MASDSASSTAAASTAGTAMFAPPLRAAREHSKACSEPSDRDAQASPDLQMTAGDDIEAQISERTEEGDARTEPTVRTGITTRMDSSDKFLTNEGGCCRCWVPKSRKARCCLATFLLTIAAFVAFIFLCFLKDPTWKLQAITIEPGDLNKMIQAFTSPNFNGTVVLPLNTTVQLDNRNVWGARVDAGNFNVTHGGLLLAEVVTLPSKIHAYSTGLTRAEATSIITPAVSELMMKELATNNYQLQVEVKGKLPAHLLGFIHFKVQVACVVDVDVLKILEDSSKLITDHQCKYKPLI